MKKFVVKLEKGAWIAPWKSDPGRTLVLDNAKLFDTMSDATIGLGKARKHRPYLNAEIEEVEVDG